MNEFDPVRALIEYMAKNLADEPELVTVVMIPREEHTLYRLAATPKDIVKIFGKGNHTVRSMRIILTAIGTKLNRNVSLEINQPRSTAS